MSRYIDADELIEKFKAEHDWSSVYIVEDMPTADVVNVVRCDNCKWNYIHVTPKGKDYHERSDDMTKKEALANFQVIKDQIEQFGEVFFDESDIPMIDVVIESLDGVHCEWIKDWEIGCSDCSHCGKGYLWEDYKGVADWKYCPNCGANIDNRRERGRYE